MNKLNLITFLLMILSSHYVNGANILFLMGPVSQSHFIWSSAILNELANRGHNLTLLFSVHPYKPEALHKNIHQIYIEMPEDIINMKLDISNEDLSFLVGGINTLYKKIFIKYKTALETKTHRILLNYPKDFKFDLILYEYTGAFVYLPFLHIFRYPPIIALSPFPNPSFFTEHKYPAYIPHYNSEYDVHMNFFQRMHNTAAWWVEEILLYLISQQVDKEIIEHYDEDIAPINEYSKYTLTLANSHPSINYAEYLPPNVIEVAGLHIFDPQPLPSHTENFINKSKKGVILFSLGTSVKGGDIGLNRSQIMLDAMAQLPDYNFLWKSDFANVDLKVPPNVRVEKFLPQRDILGHPKTKVFVTHAGGLSVQEAIWRGVPMVTIPIFVDQFRNSRQSIVQGIAEKVDYFNFSVEVLRDTIRKVAEDPKYSRNVKDLSSKFRDRPRKPLDTAVWWIEYIIRNPKATYLRSPAADLGFIRANSLDVIFVFIGCFSFLLILLLKSICIVSIYVWKRIKNICKKYKID